jgi:hypothetical protein
MLNQEVAGFPRSELITLALEWHSRVDRNGSEGYLPFETG